MQIVIQVITSFLNFCTWLGEGAIRLVLWLVQQIQWLGQRFWRMTDSHIHPFYFRKYQSGHQSPHRHLKTTTHKKNPSYPLSKFPALRKVDAWMARSTYLSGYRSPRRLMYLVGLLLLIVLTPLLWWRIGHQPEQVQAGWWDDTWRYRQTVSITNGSGSVLTNFQVSFTLDTAALITAGKLQSNCDDIRVTDINGSVLPIWLETGSNACNTTSTAIWVKSPTIPTTGAVLYVYYGNSQAVNNQNGNAVFEFFDDFSGSSIDSTKWTQGTIAATSGTDFSVSAGNLNGGNSNRFIQSIESFSGNYIAETRIFETTAIANGFMPIGFFASTGNSFGILSHNTTSYYRNDAGWTNFAFNGVGQWSRDKVAVVGTSATYWRTGETTGTATATVTNSGISSENLRLSARYDGSATNQNYVATWDWIFVRKAVATAPTVAAPSNEETTPGSVGYWKFDEGSGTSAGDSSGNGKTGAFLSAPIWKTEDLCVSGKCLAFDNVDDGVSITGENFTSLSDYTMCAWVNPKGAHKNYTGTIMSSGNWNNTHWAVGINQANTSIQTRKADGVNSPTWAYTVPRNQWTHICVTRSGTTITAYANATQVGSPYTGVAGNLISNATNTTIGRETYAGGNFAFNGWIDEPKIYPYARTLAQIKADYSAGKAAMGTSQGNQASLGANPAESGNNLANGLVGYWKMDESATPSLDSSGNNLSGTWTNTPTASTGKFGNATSFTGTANIALGNQSIVDNLANFTIAAWVYPSAQTAGTHFRVFSEESVLYVGQYGSQVSLYMGNGTAWTQSDVTGGALALNQWNHVIWTKNGTSASVYINGVLSKNNMPASASLGTSANTNHISTSNGSTQPWNGKLDEVRIYNRALSPAEVNALYNWAPGPKLYYNLDEASGSTVNDTSGNGYTGTVLSNTATVVGKFGNAKESAVAGTGVTFSGFSSGTEWSMMAWSHFPLDSNSGSWRTLFANNGGSYHHIIVSNTSGAGEIGTYNAGWYSSGYNIGSLTGWHHVAAIATGGTTKFYIDGVFVGTSSSVVNYNVSIVGNYVAGGDQTWGKFDDVKIYNYARTPAQIIEDMNAGHPVPGSPVASALAHYKFDEGYGTTTANWGNGGTALNASITGATWTNNGKFGKALDFNGASSYVSFATQPINWSSRNRTISVWLQPESADLTGEHDIVTGYAFSTDYSRMRLRYSAGKIYYMMMIYPGPTYATLTSTSSLVAGNWYHVLVTWDETKYYLYINGILEATYNGSTVTTDSIVFTTIGANIDSGDPATYTNGLIDEVKFYTSSLTADQVKAEYNQGKSEVLGAVGTESDGITPSFSANRAYCVPGDTATCNPPVAEWKFDENTGTTANDTSGNNNTGSFNGDPIWTVGKNGSALSFDGIDDYVNMGDIRNISDSTLPLSISAWVKKTDISGTEQIVGKQDANSPYKGYGIYFEGTDLKFNLIYSHTTDSLVCTASGFSADSIDGDWAHVGLTYSGSKNASGVLFFVNGIQYSCTASTNTLTSSDISTSFNFQIGARNGSSYPYQGQIDNVRIYNYARTPAQIAWEYNQGAPIAHYKFDECQGTTINNSSLDGNGDAAGNDGTLTIGGSGTNTTPGTCATTGAWADGASGKFNSAMDFDGVDDYTTLGSDITVPKNDSSISWWMKRSVSQYETLFSRLPNALYCMIEVTSTNGIRIESYTNNVWTAVLPTGINTSDGQWHHYTVVFGAANTRLFVDGKLASTGSANTDTANFVVRYFGYKGTTGYGTWLTGQLDDVRIYNYALTADQVQTVYSDGAVSFR